MVRGSRARYSKYFMSDSWASVFLTGSSTKQSLLETLTLTQCCSPRITQSVLQKAGGKGLIFNPVTHLTCSQKDLVSLKSHTLPTKSWPQKRWDTGLGPHSFSQCWGCTPKKVGLQQEKPTQLLCETIVQPPGHELINETIRSRQMETINNYHTTDNDNLILLRSKWDKHMKNAAQCLTQTVNGSTARSTHSRSY